MKKKFGFTLAEVLITMSIIGVVAAMATPALVTGAQKAKIGPSIRKFMSTIENANEFLVSDKETNTITAAVADAGEYLTELEKYVEGRADGTLTADPAITPFTSSAEKFSIGDGYTLFSLKAGDAFAISLSTPQPDKAKGSYKGIAANIYYDINGFDTKPNKIGKDIFYLVMDNSGSVIPYGGKMYAKAYDAEGKVYWSGSCDETKVADGTTCSGSIADNNWKVIYRY